MSQASHRKLSLRVTGALVAAAALLVAPSFISSASAQMMSYAPTSQDGLPDDNVMVAPQADQDMDSALPQSMRRVEVNYASREAPGTVIIDTANTHLYYVLRNNRAIRYGVGVGREGFTWSGVQTVSRKAAWPNWIPPAEMIARQPYLPRFVAGGPGNPLGAAAMYLGASTYRIHGTNDPSTIGKFVSSGCIRLTNGDVQDLASRVSVGTKVVVLAKTRSAQFEAKPVHRGNENTPRAGAGRPMSQNIRMSGLY